MLSFHISPGGSLRGECQVPADKSISHRAVLLAAIAFGESTLENFLEAEDTLHTLKALQALGVSIEHASPGVIQVQGKGLFGIQNSALCIPLYCGNSGTSLRLLAGLLAGQNLCVELTGDVSLSKRPMQRVIDPLTQMGAKIEGKAGGFPPLVITPTSRLRGIQYRMKVASAQVKSSILLAGLTAEGETTVFEPVATRDHTERLLVHHGYPLHTEKGSVRLKGGGELKPTTLKIPGDFSSAAFFIVGATIAPNSELLLQNVGINPTRIGALHLLQKMGASILLMNKRMLGQEPVADILVKSAELRGISIEPAEVPGAIDELPALFIAAACAGGKTLVRGAKELRVKESDRIHTMACGLSTLGVSTEEHEDGLVIEGGQYVGGVIESAGDHRVAMAFAIAGLRAKQSIQIRFCENVRTSFPNFVECAKTAGLNITQVDA
ncbi:MAG: 3-phosphoshikimate 1-carboxyvinyltransferase [Gammaproteobacteria bacterium]|nr:3-phosphoshikimate 1-carboxyvinyltransferase [Gammaproteobacteria bacterium]